MIRSFMFAVKLCLFLSCCPLITLAQESTAVSTVAITKTFKEAPLTSPSQRWLAQDVAYIITPEERAAFARLHTDEEREMFIEQFWLRRDPKPDTEENEFRDAYYSRIAYANELFGFRQTAGWQSDRGRTHILYGPPDEIRHDGLKEIWTYQRRVEFKGSMIFQFIDLNRDGDYRLIL